VPSSSTFKIVAALDPTLFPPLSTKLLTFALARGLFTGDEQTASESSRSISGCSDRKVRLRYTESNEAWRSAHESDCDERGEASDRKPEIYQVDSESYIRGSASLECQRASKKSGDCIAVLQLSGRWSIDSGTRGHIELSCGQR
jgi:hypothetical protein